MSSMKDAGTIDDPLRRIVEIPAELITELTKAGMAE